MDLGILYSCIHFPNKSDCMDQGLKLRINLILVL